jgi:CRISPR type II-A-associated protein Csn2
MCSIPIKGWCDLIKLCKYGIENEIFLSPESFFTFQIENSKIFFNYINELNAQINGEEGDFHLWKGIKEIDIENSVEIFTDLLNFEVNNKRFLNLLYKKFNLFLGIENSNLDKLTSIQTSTCSIMDNFQVYSGIDIEYTEPLNYDFLIKGFNLKIKEEEKSLLEKIVLYINSAKELKKLEVVIIMFAKAYLSKNDIMQLHKHCEYNNICLLFIEAHEDKEEYKNERKLIIDNDLCEIVIESNESNF